MTVAYDNPTPPILIWCHDETKNIAISQCPNAPRCVFRSNFSTYADDIDTIITFC
jgi:hypothetical protein